MLKTLVTLWQVKRAQASDKRRLALSERVSELREARAGIDFQLHPDVWNAVDADLRRCESKLRSLLEKENHVRT